MQAEPSGTPSYLRRGLKAAFRRLQPLVVPPRLLITRTLRCDMTVGLTFDDGPDPAHTLRLLNILNGCRCRAVLFWTGSNVERNTDLVRRAVAEGHQVSNHGFDHSVRPKDGWTAYKQNILRGEAALRQATPNSAWRFFRPPRGQFPMRLALWALAKGRTIALWSLDSRDYSENPDAVMLRVSPERVKPGEVILLHEDEEETLNMLPVIIERLRVAGFRFTTLQQMTE